GAGPAGPGPAAPLLDPEPGAGAGMTLDFPAPEPAQRADGTPPLLRSPIEWALRDQGANFIERAGWRVVSDYGDQGPELTACRESVGVADLSLLGKLELQADPEVASSIVAEVTGGEALAPGRAKRHEGVWWCPMTRSRVRAVT